MKKIVSIVLAVVMITALTVSAFALGTNKTISTQVYAQPNSDWSWKSAGTMEIPFGESVEVKFIDFASFAGLDSSAKITFGIQNVDMTLDTEGDTSRIVYTMSDVVIKATGYDDYVVPATKRDATLTAKNEAWGLAHVDDTIELDLAAACGSEDFAEHAKYLAAITEVTYTLTYVGYNDEVAEGAAVEATPEPAPETTAPETTAPAPETTPDAPKTGLALAVVPAVMALAAVAVSKKH